jgi:mRNA interferase MazF
MPSMTTYQPGDFLLVAFPFVGGVQSKKRPALVLIDTGDLDLVLARVTTQVYNTAHDVTLHQWRQAGLIAPSWVRLHKLATVEKTLVTRLLGHIEPTDRQHVAAVLNGLFGAW